MNKSKYSMDWGSMKKKMLDSGNKKKSYEDKRFYYPDVKENGTAEVLIRFLPVKFVDDKPTTDFPYVEFYKHNFKHNGSYFINDCPSTIGLKCPVCEDVRELYKDTETEKLGKYRYKKTEFISNVLVVNDPQNPQNNGKVFLFRFGKKVKEKIWDKMGMLVKDGEVSLKKPVMVFDFFEGANFLFKIKKTAKDVDGKSYPDYSTSEWEIPAPIVETDAEADALNEKMFDLSEFTNPDKFKSYEELAKRYATVVGGSSPKPSSTNSVKDVEDEASGDLVVDEVTESASLTVDEDVVAEDDDFFAKLRSDDNV